MKTDIFIFAVIGKLSQGFRHSQMQLWCTLHFSYSSAQTAVLCTCVCPFQSAGSFPLLSHCKLYLTSELCIRCTSLWVHASSNRSCCFFFFFFCPPAKSPLLCYTQSPWILKSGADIGPVNSVKLTEPLRAALYWVNIHIFFAHWGLCHHSYLTLLF